MSFNFDFVNYSSYDVPLQKANFPPQSYTYNNINVDGKNYRVNIDYARRESVYIPSTTTTTITAPSIYYALKAKDKELYLIWYISGKSWDTTNINIYISHSLSNPTEILIYNGVFVNASGGKAELYMFINTYNNFICLGFEKETNVGEGILGVSIDEMSEIFGEFEGSLYSNEYGNASTSGGYSGGSFDNSSDTITIPNTPTIGVTNVGFINAYAPSLNNLLNFGAELFPSFESPEYDEDLTDITDSTALEKALAQSNIFQFNILKNIYNSFANSKLIEFVLDCHCIPVSPTISAPEKIKVGYKEFETQSPKVTRDYVDFDCGTLNIDEYYANFIDYVGTRAKLYLPFIGFVDIQPEYFQSGFLQVVYRFNIIDGSFMAYVLSSSSKSQLTNTVIASYGGNACVHLPITSTNYSTMISSVLNGTAGVVSGLTHGNPIGALNSALNTLSSKPDMQSSNGYNSSSAYLGIRYPYLIIEREVSNFSEKYTNEYGLPCNITKTINELSGFVQMDNIHLETLSCTDDEKTLIQNLLQNGIII